MPLCTFVHNERYRLISFLFNQLSCFYDETHMNTIIDYSQPILAIDTSTNYLSLALRANGVTTEIYQPASNQQAELILPKIQQLLQQENIQVSDLEAIVYAQGPGAFTGLRIGIGVAKGLATPFQIPLIAIPTLDAVAYQVENQQYVLAAIDARMNEIFYAWFDTKQHQRLSDYSVSASQNIQLPENIAIQKAIGLGNAYALPNPPTLAGQAIMPKANIYIQLAQSQRYPIVSAEQAELLYIRNKIALTTQEQAMRKQTIQAA